MKEESKTCIEVNQSQLDLLNDLANKLNKKFGIALKLVKRKQVIRKLFGI